MNSQTLQDILSADPTTVAGETSIADVLDGMARRHISCVLAVDAERRPTGIFTERDAVSLMASGTGLDAVTMNDVMRQPVFTVAADLDSRDAYRQMSARGFRHLVVVDAAGRLVGIVSEGDFMHHLGMEYLVELKTVASAMTPDPITLDEHASLHEAVAVMAERRISCVLITRDEAPVGVITERDLVRLARQSLDAAAIPLAQVMSGPVHDIDAASPLREAARQMRAAGIRRLAVIADGRLVGLITRHDIVQSLHGRYIEYLHETLQRQSEEMERANNKARAAQQRLRGYSLMEQISDAIFVIDAGNAAIVEVNNQACHSLGYAREALLALDVHRLSKALPDATAWLAFLEALRARGQIFLETGLRRHDGGDLPVQINARLIDADGQAFVVVAARDLSRIREQDAQLQLQIHALNAAGNAIIITDTTPRILWANAAFSTLTGYSLAEAIGRKPAELVKSGEQDQPYYQRMWDSILAGQVWRGELINKHKDGSLYHEDLTITPVSIDGKVVSHFVAIKQDISARKAAEAALRLSEQRLRLALQGANAGIWEWNIRSQAVYWSDENYRVLGLPLPGEGGGPASYERWLHCVHPEDRARVQAQVEAAVTQSSDMDIEFRVVWPDGGVHWINDRGQFFLDAQGQAVSMVGIQLDITARKTAELALRESEERFRLLYERAPVAYQSLDARGHILEVNAAWLAQLGYPPEAVIGRPFSEFLAPGQEALLKERFGQFLASGTVRGADFDLLRHDGATLVFEVEGRVGRDSEGRFKQTHCVLHNITERKALERRLTHLAATDALTGLANRRHFLDQMALALARQKRHDTHTALLMLDLDWFKSVNDRHGHAAGDEVLRHTTAVMASSLRRIDLLGRLGGEEFAILLHDTEATGAHEFAERLRQQVAAQPTRGESGDIPITLSIGVTTFAPQDDNIDAILARADRALYRAKEHGRNRVELEPPP
ncbi:MAG: PAS domain S-box protein [Gallionellaceae bacterium]|nr:PAS domain S-box protein [Gallionellaceae bacterium]